MNSSRSGGSFGSFDDGIKTGWIADSNFAEHLAVQLDVDFFAGIDELAVPDTALPTGGAQA